MRAGQASPIPPAIAEQAVHWLLELQETAWSPPTVTAWRQWRAADPEHERAWQHIEAVQGRFQALRPGPGDGPPVDAAARQALLSPPRGTARRHAIKTLAVLLFTGSGTLLLHDTQPVQQWNAQLRTRRGQTIERVLDDGSQIILAGGSALNLRFSDSHRRVELVGGEVFIETAHPAGDARPFEVLTRFGRAIALGTRYSVQLQQAPLPGALVAVFDGAVQLQPAEPAAGTASAEEGGFLTLQAGQQALLRRAAAGPVQGADPNRAAWTQGMLIAENMRLDAFLAELAQHTAYELGHAPEVAALRISGSYPTADIYKVLESIAMLHRLRLETRTGLLSRTRLRLLPRR